MASFLPSGLIRRFARRWLLSTATYTNLHRFKRLAQGKLYLILENSTLYIFLATGNWVILANTGVDWSHEVIRLSLCYYRHIFKIIRRFARRWLLSTATYTNLHRFKRLAQGKLYLILENSTLYIFLATGNWVILANTGVDWSHEVIRLSLCYYRHIFKIWYQLWFAGGRRPTVSLVRNILPVALCERYKLIF